MCLLQHHSTNLLAYFYTIPQISAPTSTPFQKSTCLLPHHSTNFCAHFYTIPQIYVPTSTPYFFFMYLLLHHSTKLCAYFNTIPQIDLHHKHCHQYGAFPRKLQQSGHMIKLFSSWHYSESFCSVGSTEEKKWQVSWCLWWLVTCQTASKNLENPWYAQQGPCLKLFQCLCTRVWPAIISVTDNISQA